MKDRADNDAPRPKVGELVTGEIADLAYGGPGVLRHDGWVVMVRGAFPGDRVGARIRRRRKGVFEADLEEVITPSPERITPACPHLAICGGCALQGLAPAAQTRYKANQAVELLRRIGKITPGEIATPWQGSTPYFYRNKMEFTFAPRPWVTREELDAGQPFGPGPALGLHPRGVFQGVFNVEDCRLQSQLSNRIVVAFRNLARQRELPAYISRTDSGLLRHLVVRQAATTADLIVIIVARNEGRPQRMWGGQREPFGFYLPFNWRAFYDFGSGLIGDWGVHILGPANWALQLSPASLVSVECIHSTGPAIDSYFEELNEMQRVSALFKATPRYAAPFDFKDTVREMIDSGRYKVFA